MVEEVIRRGLVEPMFRIWDRANRKVIAEFDFGILKNDTRYPFAVQCEQHKLANMAIERLKAFPHAKVEFSSRVAALRATDDGVEIEVEGPTGTRKIDGLVPDRLRRRPLDGAQGAGHRVRRLHPSRTLPDPDHDVRLRHRISGLHAQLFLRSGRVVLAVQGDRRRRQRLVARAVSDAASSRRTRRLMDRGDRCRAGCRNSFPKPAPTGRSPQSLQRAPARRGIISQGPRVPGGRRRARQQSARRPRAEFRHPRRDGTERTCSAASSAARRRPISSITTTSTAGR